VDLQQVKARNLPQPARSLDLRSAARGGPDLVGRKHPTVRLELAQGVADDALRRAVHGRGIDQAAACLEKVPHHLGALFARRRVAAHVEGDPAAKAHQRNVLGR
jgi:hypothetical protein